MPTVVIQQVVQGPVQGKPFSSHNKMIEVVEWMVNALVDGQPVQNIKLRAFSPKVLWTVYPGGTAVCDPPKMHQNQVEYKITTPSDANGGINSQQGQAPMQQPMQQPVYAPPAQPMYHTTPTPSLMPPVIQQQPPPAWAVPTAQTKAPPQAPRAGQVQPSYTQEEYEDVLMQGMEFSRAMFNDKKTDPAVIASFAATYVIGATRLGIKIPSTRPAKAPGIALVTNAVADKMWEIIMTKGLGERTQNANVPEPVLMAWFEEAGQDANAYVIRLNYELKKIEAGVKE